MRLRSAMSISRKNLMKKKIILKIILISLIFLPLIQINLLYANFDLMPLRVHFFGAVDAGGENIIAYGTNGAYLMSTDKGVSWDQYQIDGEFGEIRKIVNHNDVLWGIIKSGKIIKSTDNGFDWEINDFELEEDDYFINIEVTDNSIYVRTKTKILLFDKDLQLVNSFSDERIKISEGSRFSKPEDCPDSYSYDFIKFHNEKLFVTTNGNSDGFYILSKDIKNANFIHLKDHIYFTNPERYELHNIMSFNDKDVYHVNGHLYYTDNNFNEWTYFFTDTSFMNTNISLRDRKIPIEGNPYSYYFNKNNLFINDIEGNVFKDIGIRIYEDTPKDTFLKYNQYFINDYLTRNYYNPGIGDKIDGISRVLRYQFLIEDSIIIRTGYAKSLLISRDDAKSWNLISYLNSEPILILSDSTFIFFNKKNKKKDVMVSNDCGATFLPHTNGIEEGLGYLEYMNSVNCFYTDSTGIGFYCAPTSNIINIFNFVYTMDGWKTVHAKNIKELPTARFYNHGSNVVRLKEKLLFAVNSLDNMINSLVLMKSDFSETKVLSYHDFAIHHIITEDLNNFDIITSSKDENLPSLIHMEIRETNDGGKIFNTIFKSEGHLFPKNIHEHNTDSVFISSQNMIYMYDRTRNVLDTIYKAEQTNNLYIAYFNNHFYIFGEKLFLVNSNPDDLTEWEPADWDYGIPSFYSIIHKGNVAIAELEDNKRPRNFYKMTIDKVFTSVEDANVEVKYYNKHFYASAPHPLPAKDYTKSRISWDMSFKLEDAIKGVYDVNGCNVEGKENIEIIHLGKASAELRWYCTTAPAGIYFIVVQHNGYTDTIPVVVVK